jgi:MerR family transcriptional regulator, copper efflux regulator
MRITEAAARLGMSPRMLRYREDLGLLPPLRDRPYGRGHAHRQFTEEDLAAITAALAIERRFDITPAALAFGLRVLTDPAARAAVADLGRRTGHVPAGPGAGRALDFEKERALRALGGAPRDPAGRLPRLRVLSGAWLSRAPSRPLVVRRDRRRGGARDRPGKRTQERRDALNRERRLVRLTTATDGSARSS